ncbi:MAG TPA: NAD(P)-dependent oxidoreductase [Candidatus Saccharimonadales bacterium]|nr:NAD(P)-dependent oxidoreductase [Candidatus Saccharimonadales bacterium]
MNITILDKLAFTAEQLGRLQQVGAVTQYDDFPDEQVAAERLKDADIAIVGWTTLPAHTIKSTKSLRYLVLAQTGYEFIDLKAAKAKNILVSNAPGYSRESVAEYAFALILAAMRHIPKADRVARHSPVPTKDLLGNELHGKTLGILGLGSIGSRIGKIGQGFDMRVIGHSRTQKGLPGIEDVSLDELLTQSDVLVIAVDINPSTTSMLSAERLKKTKEGVTLVSVVGNHVLDEQTVAELLRTGHIRCAAFEELSHGTYEGSEPKNSLLDAPNVVLSPQAGWYTVEAERRLLDLVIDNIESFVAGNPKNLV